jgi:hypothetical protein
VLKEVDNEDDNMESEGDVVGSVIVPMTAAWRNKE